VWAGPGVIDPVAGVFDPISFDAGPGQHLITYEYLDDGCTFTESVMISVFDVPEAVISNTSLLLTCENNNQLILDGSSSSPSANLVYTWTTTDGFILDDPSSPAITAGGAGQYTLHVLDTMGYCMDSVSVELLQDANVPVAAAGANQMLDCNQTTVDLGDNSSSSGDHIVYSWTTNDGNFLSDVNSKSVEVDMPGLYELVVTDTMNGCSASDIVEVLIDTLSPEIFLSVSGIIDCVTEEVSIKSTINPSGLNYLINWSTSDGNIITDPGIDSIIVDRTGVYSISTTNQQNGCSDIANVEVLGDSRLIEDVNYISSDPLCFGSSDGWIEIAQIIGGTPPFAFLWTGGSQDSLNTGLSSGTHTIEVTDAIGCQFVLDIGLNDPVRLYANVPPDLEVIRGDTVEIIVGATVPLDLLDSIIWEGNFAFFCNNCPRTTFIAENSGPVHVTVIDSNGCISSDELFVNVLVPKEVYIPNVFSPNGDGINDLFTISANSSLINIESLQIFDRWGEVVYKNQNFLPNIPELGWDGRYGDKDIMPGVYVYSAKVTYSDGVIEVIKGDVTLIR
jgi:gliding motility-associated-like protein